MATKDTGWQRWASGPPIDEPVPTPGRRDLKHASIESVTDREYLSGIYRATRTIRNLLGVVVVILLVWSVLWWLR